MEQAHKILKPLYLLTIIALLLGSCDVERYKFRKKIELAAPVLNSACPLETPYGSVQRVYIEHDTLCSLIKAGSAYEGLMTAPENLLMKTLLFTLDEDTTYQQLTDILREMATYQFYLRLRVDVPPAKGATKDASIWLYASPQLLDSVFNNRFTERERALTKVLLQIHLIQHSLPYQINEQMTMTDIHYADGEVQMAYRVVEDGQINLERADFRTTAQLFLRQRIWNELIRSRKPEVHEVIKQYYLSGSRLRYTCTGASSGGQVQVLLTQGDLRMLLSHYGIHL